MAAVTPDKYVNSGGDDTDGSTMAKGYADFETADSLLSAGNQVFVAHNHSVSSVSSATVTLPDAVDIYSVNVTTEVYEAGAREGNAGGNADYVMTLSAQGDSFSANGFHFAAGDDNAIGGENMTAIVNDCILESERVAGASSPFTFITDSRRLELFDCQMISPHASSLIFASQGNYGRIDGLTAGAGHVKVDAFFQPSTGGGNNIVIINSDLGAILATNGALYDSFSSSYDGCQATLDRCTLPTGFTIFGTTPTTNFNYEINLTSCDAGDGYHYFYFLNSRGEAEEDTAQYMTTSEAKYDGTNRFSAQISTSARCTAGHVFRYKMATFAAQDLTTDQTVSMEIAGPSGATDTDIWMELVVNDNTNEALGSRQTTRNSDIVAAGTALTSSSEVWVTTTDTEYTLSKAIGALTNVDNGNVDVYICSSLTSAVFNVDLPTIAAT